MRDASVGVDALLAFWGVGCAFALDDVPGGAPAYGFPVVVVDVEIVGVLVIAAKVDFALEVECLGLPHQHKHQVLARNPLVGVEIISQKFGKAHTHRPQFAQIIASAY